MNILLVHKKSTLDLMNEHGGFCEKKYIINYPKRHEELIRAHNAHYATLDLIKKTLINSHHKFLDCTRHTLKASYFDHIDLVITAGGDGTILDVAKYIHNDIPILGVNTDPVKSTGHFCASNMKNFVEVFQKIERNEMPKTTIRRLALYINNTLHASPILNDIYIANEHQAEMMRLDVEITHDAKNPPITEFIRSSGLLICTGVGSSAWMYNEGGVVMQREDTRLQYKELGRRHGINGFAQTIKITSHMYCGLLCIDGAHQLVKFSFGDIIEIRSSDSDPSHCYPITLIGNIHTPEYLKTLKD